MKKLLLTFCVLVATSVNTFAGGFQLSDHDARAVGMGFAVITEPTNASTIFFNPAGMTMLEKGYHATFGVAAITPGATFAGPTNFNNYEETSLEPWTFFIPHLYLAWNSGEGLAAGIGVFVPYGLGTEWDPNWSGRHLAIRTYLETITINPNVAYSFMDGAVSVAAGVTYSFGRAELRQKIASFDPEPVLDLEGTGTAWSWNAGILVQATEHMRIAAAYRHNIDMVYDGDATFEVTDALRPLFQNGPGGTGIDLPFDLRLGVSYQFTEKLNVELGADLVGWSSYDTLNIRFDKAPGNPATSTVRQNPREYFDAWTFRVGAEYEYNKDWTLRAGTYFDSVPVDAEYTQPILPDANRLGFSVGTSFDFSPDMSIDVGYLFIYGLQRDVENSDFNFDGSYKAWANVGAVTFNYAF